MRQRLVEVTIVTGEEEMKQSREYEQGGTTYVEGVKGQRYGIKVKNLTSSRIELVPTVDGLDVHDGKDGSVEKRGLVIGPYGETTFEGFRLDDKSVATFRFGGVEKSYAARIGKPRNVGVIGLAVFEESRPFIEPFSFGGGYRGAATRGGGDTYGGMKIMTLGMSPERSGSIGTEFGERRESVVGKTTFTRATTSPAELVSFRYETAEQLKALGIDVVVLTPELDARESASPFPGSAPTGCQPPDGWTGKAPPPVMPRPGSKGKGVRRGA